ncbi:MAG: hypothetical protein IJP42_03285 [Selenomonadaceae bacterium]|nr:hypothetical protein [Selenomonadaceae bacterium]MBR0060476.1 hypothetical protein [Selenomonadaceae bacterium]
MTYELILSYSKYGVSAEYDCDDEELYQLLHDDEIFQDLVGQLMARFRDMAYRHDSEGE